MLNKLGSNILVKRQFSFCSVGAANTPVCAEEGATALIQKAFKVLMRHNQSLCFLIRLKIAQFPRIKLKGTFVWVQFM